MTWEPLDWSLRKKKKKETARAGAKNADFGKD